MKQFWIHLLEFLNLTGISELMAFIAWPGMLLGIGLIFMGSFFSPSCFRAAKEGHSPLRNSKFKATMRVGGRLSIVIGGIILIIGSVVEGHRASKAVTEEPLINAMASARPPLAEKLKECEDALLYSEKLKSDTMLDADMSESQRDGILKANDENIKIEKSTLAELKYLQKILASKFNGD